METDITPIDWHTIPGQSWVVLEHLRYQVLLGDPFFELKGDRWYTGYIYNDIRKLSDHSYAQSTVEPLIKCNVLHLNQHDDKSILNLTQLGYVTATQDLSDEIVFGEGGSPFPD